MSAAESKRAIVGVHNIGLVGCQTDREVEERARQMLARSLNLGKVVAFVGSGVSAAYGHKKWGDLVTKVVALTASDPHVRAHIPPDLEDIFPSLDIRKDEYRITQTTTPSGLGEVTVPSAGDQRKETKSSDDKLIILDICGGIWDRSGKGTDFREKIGD